jgi:lysophospholipase L1-like esterase
MSPSNVSSFRLRSRLLLCVASTCAALLLVEIGVRVWAACSYEPSLRESLGGVEVPEPGGPARWLHALRLDPNERIGYALRANFDGRIPVSNRTMHLVTNRHGFRGREWAIEKPAGTLRIVGLGDSVMFGWGVDVEATYMARLERLLVERQPTPSCEVINLAVGGYNTVQQVETLEQVGLALRPDVVIVNLVDNDANGIIYTDVRPDAWAFDRSFAHEWFVRRADPRASPTFAGLEPFRAALARLERLGREHGIPVLVMTHLHTREIGPLFALARDAGLDTLDLGAATAAHMRDLGLRGYFKSPLSIPQDGHPSEQHHALLAQDLFDALVSRGWVGSAPR